MNQTIAIAGASGFIGTHLQEVFENVVVLERNDSVAILKEKLKGVDVVINLAGAPIIKRWSKSYKALLYSSRIETVRKLVEAINGSEVKHFISASAIGIYPNDKKCDESTTRYADDFLAKLCIDWEKEAMRCTKPTTIVRIGMVLGKRGGALKKMLLPFKLGLGGTIGDGKMMTSWITIEDLVNIYRFLIENRLEGVFNATSPKPVSNELFTKALGKALHRPTFLPLPTFVLKALFGEASSVMTDSKEVYPKRLQEAGFEFKHSDIDSALSDIIMIL